VKGSGRGLIWGSVMAFVWKDKRSAKILRIVDVQIEIWTKYRLDMSQMCLLLESTFSVMDPYKQKLSNRTSFLDKLENKFGIGNGRAMVTFPLGNWNLI